MSKLMLIFGILFLGLGVALGLLIQFSPGQMQVLALTPDVAAIFLVGGALCIGLGGVIGSLQEGSIHTLRPEAANAAVEVPAAAPATPKFAGFGKKSTAEETAGMSPAVVETISALEQAKSDIAAALGVDPHDVEEVSKPVESAIAAEPESAAAVEEEGGEDNDLYVVEEKVIRGRPARVLSDGTVEAETDEGWMRFENLEHLDEYLEAMVPGA